MALFSTTQNFASGETVTSTKLDAIVGGLKAESDFADDATVTVTAAGRIRVGTVTESNLGAASVTASKIGSNAVTTAKIQDAAVTFAKMGAVLDEDDMASDSAVHVPTQQSVKAYVDQRSLVAGTAQASTSGTSIDFTGIPSWARRITIMFRSVSTSGTSPLLVQIGNGSFVTSGYTGTVFTYHSSSVSSMSTGFLLSQGFTSAATVRNGAFQLHRHDGNEWVMSGVLEQSVFSGGVSLAGALDRVRITTVGGTDTFDAGSINILWE